MGMKTWHETILGEIDAVLRGVKEEELHALCDRLHRAPAVFVAGEGRSGLMAKAFAMRLMHIGKNVFVVGETIAPGIRPGDLLLAVSGTGETETVCLYAGQAKKAGASVVSITSYPHSRIAGLSDFTVTIPAATKRRRAGEPATVQPLGNQFDQCLHLALDYVAMEIAKSMDISHDAMASRHASLQ
jgi:6-phospho-3-hexuloisomerase